MKQTILLTALLVLGTTQAPAAGLKNFREIYEHLKTATEVEVTPNSQMANLFSNLREKLPRYGYSEELGPATRKSVLTLASSFCERRAQLDQQQQASAPTTVLFPKIEDLKNFEAAKDKIRLGIETTSIRLWGRKPSDSEANALLDLANQFYKESNNGISAETLTASLCLTIASSLETILSH